VYAGKPVAIKKLRSLGGDERALKVSLYHVACTANL
jgi:hypothetical protein